MHICYSMRQTTNVLRKEYSANTVLVVRLLWGRSRGCAMDWDELAVTDEGLEGEGFRDRGWRGWVGMRAWVGGWWCHQSRAGGNLLPRGIIGGLGNLNISSLSHLSSSPVLKKWIISIEKAGESIFVLLQKFPQSLIPLSTERVQFLSKHISRRTAFDHIILPIHFQHISIHCDTFQNWEKLHFTILFCNSLRVYFIAVDFALFNRWSISPNTRKFCQRLLMCEFSTDWQQCLEKVVTVNTSLLPFKVRPTPAHAIVKRNRWFNGFSKAKKLAVVRQMCSEGLGKDDC